MAKIKITGDVATITSEITVEDIKLLQSNHPEALTVLGRDGEQTFKIAYGDKSSVSKYGIEFNAVSRTSGNAIVCVAVQGETIDELKEDFVNKYGSAMQNLEIIEETYFDDAQAIKDSIAAMKDSIEIE